MEASRPKNGNISRGGRSEPNGVQGRLEPVTDAEMNNNMLPKKEKNIITERIFVARESPLTVLFNSNPHLRTVYHLFMVILIMMFLNNMVYDLFDKGELNFGQRLIIIGFGKIHIVAAVWICMQIICFSALYLVRIWAVVRLQNAMKGVLLKAWDSVWIAIYIAIFLFFFAFPTYSILHFELPIASTNIVALEMFRFMMKVYSFIRNCCPRILHSKKIGKTKVAASLPSFSHYTYFMFAPTLLYRDSYPRTSHVRKYVVAKHLLEVVGVAFYISFLCEKFIYGLWFDYGLQDKNAAHVAADIFTSSLPGILTFLSGFYCLLHAWHNAFAEMLRFADRQFYKEWWITSEYGAYFRMWNSVVHDWLRSHVYNEVLPLGGRTMATMAVFVVSAFVHEIVLSLAFRFFYPVLFIMFGAVGMFLSPLCDGLGKSFPALGNLLMWLSFVIGNGLLWSLYSMEYFARINCNTTNASWWIPVSWSCPAISLKPDWKFNHPFSTVPTLDS